MIYWIRNRAPSWPTKVKNRSTPCTIILKVFNIYRRGIRLVHVLENFNRYIVRLLWCSETYDYQNEKNCWPGVVLEASVPSQRVPVNPALQVHLNCESSSCDAIQVPPFKQVESSQGSSAKGNIHAGVTSWRPNDCFILIRTPVILKHLDKVKGEEFYSYMGVCNINRNNQVQRNKVKNPNWREAHRQMTIYKRKGRFTTASYHETSLYSGQRAI